MRGIVSVLAPRPTGENVWPRGLRRRLARRAWWTQYATMASLVALVVLGVLGHAPWYMLRHPYWLDESWVADSLRAPLGALPRLTSSSPIGFSFLLRLVPTALGDERARLVPLLFTGALAPVAYLLGRELDRESRGTALLLGFTGVALPAAMMRHDLKQYTADAFVAVTLFFTIGAFLFEDRVVHWTTEFVLALAWLAVALSIGSIGLLYWLIRHQAATSVASLFYLVPAVTAVMAFVLFNERLDAVAIAGMVACAAAVFLVNRRA